MQYNFQRYVPPIGKSRGVYAYLFTSKRGLTSLRLSAELTRLVNAKKNPYALLYWDKNKIIGIKFIEKRDDFAFKLTNDKNISAIISLTGFLKSNNFNPQGYTGRQEVKFENVPLIGEICVIELLK